MNIASHAKDLFKNVVSPVTSFISNNPIAGTLAGTALAGVTGGWGGAAASLLGGGL